MKHTFFFVSALTLLAAGNIFAQNNEVPGIFTEMIISAEQIRPETDAAPEAPAGVYGELKEAVESCTDLTVFAHALDGMDADPSVLEQGVTVFSPVDTSNPDVLVLTGTIEDYIVPGKFDSAALTETDTVTALSGKELPVIVEGDLVTVNGIAITEPESLSTDSVIIYKISAVFAEPMLGKQ